jgi:hypothetical protein
LGGQHPNRANQPKAAKTAADLINVNVWTMQELRHDGRLLRGTQVSPRGAFPHASHANTSTITDDAVV